MNKDRFRELKKKESFQWIVSSISIVALFNAVFIDNSFWRAISLFVLGFSSIVMNDKVFYRAVDWKDKTSRRTKMARVSMIAERIGIVIVFMIGLLTFIYALRTVY